MEKAKILSDLIEKKGISRRAFAEAAGIPATTLQSMLTRGVGRASIDSVIKVCKGLGITIDQLEKMAAGETEEFETIAAHKEGEEWTVEELETIKKFKEFVRSQREQDKNHQG
ncbi:helix-turn-helix transcriptional regulator [Paenibacillus macquariensis]|uniref:Helix-turn-helix n=1 Tax=Paenibacillus macquariensis TaxID=948756 RepID=A0ABY1JSA1_9BACL|nr:helix-turn-helix transcriptional regulator [Paenibacillus macquariensis]MEC0092855.1 helix-turn-helix transcriptional regulator [Paenibacillus macquariensis]SIQ67604.1 Helix-turn-helix [Paenibacillus macquariensis]